MAGYNYFPATYQPNYYGGMYNPQPNVPQIPTPAPAPQPQQANSGLIWVQGESGAKSYLVAPNTTVLLMDSESNNFYLKSSDASGMPLPLRTFVYEEKTATAAKAIPEAESVEYVTKAEFDEFKTALKSRFKSTKENISKETKDE